VIEHHALDYDHARAAAKMRARSLPEGYAACLETGLCPSCDVLTPTELRRRGIRLSPGRVLWISPFALAIGYVDVVVRTVMDRGLARLKKRDDWCKAQVLTWRRWRTGSPAEF